jgi:putative intracellular protease/amidase
MNIAVLLFDDFETLDVFGPVEIFGRLTDLYAIKFYSLAGGIITNKHGIQILSDSIQKLQSDVEIFIVPGGQGTRAEVDNQLLIEQIKNIAEFSNYVFTVCTGSALLAKTGLLAYKKATSNKRAFDWVITNGQNIDWDRQARWVVDDKYYTSSGVSAGIDMALGFISAIHGLALAQKIAFEIEYIWINDKDNDCFGIQ